MSMCRVFSYVVGRTCLLCPLSSLGTTLLAFALLNFVAQGQICLFLHVFLDFLLLHSSPLWWKKYLFFVLVLEGLVVLHRAIQFQLFQHYLLGIVLDYCYIEWVFLEMNRDHTVIFEIAPKCCILDSPLDYEGHSISSKGFLSTVVVICYY